MSDPVCIAVPVGNYSETDLIAALDDLFRAFSGLDDPSYTNNGDGLGRGRAADWLQAKYGTQHK